MLYYQKVAIHLSANLEVVVLARGARDAPEPDTFVTIETYIQM